MNKKETVVMIWIVKIEIEKGEKKYKIFKRNKTWKVFDTCLQIHLCAHNLIVLTSIKLNRINNNQVEERKRENGGRKGKTSSDMPLLSCHLVIFQCKNGGNVDMPTNERMSPSDICLWLACWRIKFTNNANNYIIYHQCFLHFVVENWKVVYGARRWYKTVLDKKNLLSVNGFICYSFFFKFDFELIGQSFHVTSVVRSVLRDSSQKKALFILEKSEQSWQNLSFQILFLVFVYHLKVVLFLLGL